MWVIREDMIQQYRSVLILAQDRQICSVANSGFSERDDNDCTAIGLRRVGCFMVYKITSISSPHTARHSRFWYYIHFSRDSKAIALPAIIACLKPASLSRTLALDPLLHLSTSRASATMSLIVEFHVLTVTRL